MGPSGDKRDTSTRRFFDIAATFEKPVLPQRGEHPCRFKVELRAIEPEEPLPDAKETPPEVKEENHPPISHLCLILDLSGSMSQYGKYELLQEALSRLIDRVTENIFVSAVAFSEGAEQIIFAEPGNKIRAGTLLKQLDRSRVKFGGCTEMAAGMRVAERLCRLFSSEYPSAVTRIYMMTDGMVHDHRECLDCAQRFIALGAEVHTFGIGRGEYDLSVLRDITDRCMGGSVKLIKNVERFVLALERTGKTTARIFATSVRIWFQTAPGILCNQVFLFRPREADASKSISDDSTEWQFPGWPNIESKRTYQILFEVLLPSAKGDQTRVGTLGIEGTVGDSRFKEETSMTLLRDKKGRCEPNDEVRKAFASCAVLSSKDPDIILEALQAKRDLYMLEGRHQEDIQEIEDRIQEVKNMRDNILEFGEDAFEDVGDVGDAISINTLSVGNGSNSGNPVDDVIVGADISGSNGDISNGDISDGDLDESEPGLEFEEPDEPTER